MTRTLVLVHGRAQQGKDSAALKQEWLAALGRGLAHSGLDLPLDDDHVRFPYYGDTLEDLLLGERETAPVIVRGDEEDADDDEELAFARGVLDDIFEEYPITDEPSALPGGPLDRDLTSSPAVLAMLRALDRRMPWASAATIALVTHDVYTYLRRRRVKRLVDDGVASAFAPGGEHVVVAHSLGSVVAYEVLHELGTKLGWKVPLFLTVGSPLGVRKIRDRIHAGACPPVVTRWLNARDRRDVVALHPLTPQTFPLDPPTPGVASLPDVDNQTDNRHGIEGYLDDVHVARAIHDALTAP